MKTIRWGIIGCGDVTEVKSGPALYKADNSSLVAVMRRNGDLAKDYAQRHNVAKWYDDGQALIDDPEVDAVYIATPPDTHKMYTLLSAKAGKPVYVEKPMALNLVECQEMIDACQTAGVPLFVAYYRRALPRFLKVKALIEAGAIGQVRTVNVALRQPPPPAKFTADTLPWRFNPQIAGGGKFVDLASHILDFLDYFLGPIRQVTGFAANQGDLYPAEDIVSSAFVFESGVQGTGTWCFTSFDDIDVIEIIGTAGKITFSSFKEASVRLTTASEVTEFEIKNPPHIQQPLIQSIVDELNGAAGACPSNGQSAARTSWVMDQMLKSYY